MKKPAAVDPIVLSERAQRRAADPAASVWVAASAGSGKTNSIAWTAHFLADLHDAANKKLFDSVERPM